MEAEQLKKEGVLTISIGFVLIIVSLILSDGYNPSGGLFWSLTNNMSLFDIAIGCEEKLPFQKVPACDDGFYLIVQTKYVISILGLLLIYGVGQYLGFFPSLKFWNKNQNLVEDSH